MGLGLAGIAQAQEVEGILRRGNQAEPATLDPIKSEAVGDGHIEQDLFEGLVYLDRDSHPAPGQAERWDLSPDGRVYTFHLRPDLRWSNGDPLTAADFVYSFRRAADPATGSKYSFLLFPIRGARAIVHGETKDLTSLGVRALDPLTLEVTLDSPTGYFLGLLSHHCFMPVHRASVEAFGSGFTRPGNLVSNGAYTLKEWVPQSRIVVVRNPNYRDAAHTSIGEVQYLPIENEGEELKRYRGGAIDITDNVPVDQIDYVRAEMAGELHITPYLGMYYISFNLTRPPFKDAPGLRNALSMVIDRELIVGKILKRDEQPAYSWVPPGIPGYQPQTVPWKDDPMPVRIEAARKLYAAAGYGPDKPLIVELRYNTSENHKRLMIAVAGMWKRALGVHTILVNEEWKVFLETRKARKLTEAFRDGWIADYADPNTFLELLQSDAGLNYSGYADPDYDALVKRAAATVDPAERIGLLQAAERLVVQAAPDAPLYAYTNPHMVKPYVRGFQPNILGYFYSKDMSLAPQGAPPSQ